MAGVLESLAAGLRAAGGVMSPTVAKTLASENAADDQMQRQVQLLQLKTQLEQQTPEAKARLEALQNDRAFRQAMVSLGPNPDLNKALQVAVKYGKPETVAGIYKAQEDRAARLQTAADNLDARKQQLQLMHEQAMARLQDANQRAEETARHNREIEALTKQGNAIRQQLADFNTGGAGGEGGGTVDNVAKMIAEGRIPPLSGFALKGAWGQNVMSRVLELNPDYQGQDFAVKQKALKDFTTGKQGNAVKSFNVALAHLDTLGNLADALQNGNTQLVNKAANAVATQLGKPNVNNFEAAKQIVADELVKAIVASGASGGALADREKAQQTVNAANSPAQLRGVINTYKELMRGQLGGLRQQYEMSTGRTDFDKFLSAEGKATAHSAPATSDTGTGLEFQGYRFPNQDALDKYKKAKGL